MHVALITGASRGIGAATARRLAAGGAAVLVAARGEEGCAAVADSIRAAGGTAWPLVLDVTADVAPALERARALAADTGPIDWLVNNAGMAVSSPLLAADREDAYARHMALNFDGARRVAEALLPDMKERGYGRVVNVASSAGLRGYAYVAAYCASKFALVGWTLAAAAELERAGVTVNAVCPHYVESPMLDASIRRLVEKTGRSQAEARAFFERENPGGRLVTADEVAAAIEGCLAGDATARLVELDGSGTPRVLCPNDRRADEGA